MAEADRRLRQQLALSGELFDGYHPDMRVLHEANARELELAVDDEGWPSVAEIGDDGAEAAFLIALHAISRPAFQRRCLTLMKSAANRCDIPRHQPAILEDRIRAMEGRPQLYGTQLDWDDDGHLAPLPIEDEVEVDARRARVGLAPLAQTLAEAAEQARREGQHPPAEWLHCQHAMIEFAQQVGWR